MLHPIIDSLETKYYSILHDLTFKEVASLEVAFTIRPKPFFAVKKEIKGKSKSFYKDEYFAHSKYSLFDQNLTPFQFKDSGWILLSIDEPSNRSRGTHYKTSDPNGEVRNLYSLELNDNWGAYFQIEGICKIIEFIRGLSNYPDWTYYDLKTENQKLSLENVKLMKKLNELEEKLNSIDNT